MICRFEQTYNSFIKPSEPISIRTSLERPAVASKVAGHVALAPEVAQVAVVVLAVVEHLKQQIHVRVTSHMDSSGHQVGMS